MGRFRDISINRKLSLIITLTSVIALLLACAAFVTYDWIDSRQTLVSRVTTLAEMVGTNSTAALTFDNEQDIIETLDALRTAPHIVEACVYAESNRVFAKYHRDAIDFTPPPVEDFDYRFTDDHLVVFQPIELENRIGTVYLRSDLKDMQDRLTRFIGIVIVFVLISSFVAFLVGSRLRQIISDPILHLARQMRIVSEEKDYMVRVDQESEDELGQLIAGFNEMLTQIQDRDVALESARDQLVERAEQLQIELVERKRIEAQITASLEEKEVLLKEIHHRVKNNLQVISSLLDLQSSNIEDDQFIEMFRDSRDRVRSMALIHESLYHSKDLAKIDFADYIRSLANNLFLSYGTHAGSVSLNMRADDVGLGVDTAIPCGLIVNELVSNALKYAFPTGQKGDLNIDLRTDADDHITLTVRDNGVGFPADLDFRNTSSLGLKLVNALVNQIGGTVDLQIDNGSEFTIEFTA
jgi:two-component sensor histidine kinase